ncbi:MAG: capsule assembly Wzi family protein [candidate division Zixibacteria bacterium]|nr:capsule assembly Wzi family protein [candidate division Zixibacteria bacterium]
MLVFKKFIIVLSLYAGLASAGILPVGRPDTDYAYRNLRELYLRGFETAPSALYAPFDYLDIQALSDNNRPHSAGRLTTFLKRTANRFEAETGFLDFQTTIIPSGTSGDKAGQSNLMFMPEFIYRISDTWSVQAAYRIDGSLADDSLYTGKVWGDFAGYAELALLSFRGKRLSLDLGRTRDFWGASRSGYGLMRSSAAMPMDGMLLNYNFGDKLSLYSTIAYLSPVSSRSPFAADTLTENRYYSAHALRISPFSWWDIILKESVIYGGVGRQLEPKYIIPFILYHGEQLNANVDDNTFLGLESVIRLKNRYAFYLELLVDDYQIENKSIFDNEPSEIGLIIGANVYDFPFEMGAIEIEYTHIANHTYNQVKPRNIYINQGNPIGHPRGPDQEGLSLSYIYHYDDYLTTEITGYLINRGEGRLADDWETPWLDQDYIVKFPSGFVERRRGVSLEIFCAKNEIIQGKMLINMTDIQNNGNISGINEFTWSARLEIILNLPKLSWRLHDEKQH